MTQKDNPPEPEPTPIEKEWEGDKEAFKEKWGVEPGAPPPERKGPQDN